MHRHSIPTSFVLWQRHEKLYYEVFSIALKELVGESVPKDEDVISERLCAILNQVCYNLSRERNIELRTPTWEGPIQPVSYHELKGERTHKRPDFTCKCVNPQAEIAEEHELPFHIECKLLGSPTSPSWNLNKNYVLEGISRFDSNTHEYGKRAFSGMMIGYIISMKPPQILEEVNYHQNKHFPYGVSIAFAFNSSCCTWYTQQYMKRCEVKPSDFKLIHLWVNLSNSVLRHDTKVYARQAVKS